VVGRLGLGQRGHLSFHLRCRAASLDTSQHSSGTPGDYAITAAVADATVNGGPRQLRRPPEPGADLEGEGGHEHASHHERVQGDADRDEGPLLQGLHDRQDGQHRERGGKDQTRAGDDGSRHG
jgi:hypothetical protein